MKKLIVMVGLPKSGKSTWAISTGYPVVSRDALGHALNKLMSTDAFHERFKTRLIKHLQIMILALFNAGHETMVLDYTNLTIQERGFWRSPDWNVEYKIIPTSLDACLSRTNDEETIKKIKIDFELCDVPEIKREE